jgi:hypothetical protein
MRRWNYRVPGMALAALVGACGDAARPASGTGGAGSPPVPTASSTTPAPTTFLTPPDKRAFPPSSPDASAAGPGKESPVYAIHSLLLGDTDSGGAPDASGWRTLGYDLDGYASTPAFPGHCKPRKGADQGAVTTDGVGGRDNSFGRAVLPAIAAFFEISQPTDLANSVIDQGQSALLRIHGLDAAPVDQTGLTLDLLPARGPVQGSGELLAPTPSQWSDGTYAWQPWSLFLRPITLEAELPSIDAYVSSQTLVARGGYLELPLNLGRMFVFLRVENPIVTLQLGGSSMDHSGVLAGVLRPDAVVAALRGAIFSVEQIEGCGAPLDELTKQVQLACDILSDGTQDPTRECDAISIGVGFSAARARLGEPALVDFWPVDRCEM